MWFSRILFLWWSSFPRSITCQLPMIVKENVRDSLNKKVNLFTSTSVVDQRLPENDWMREGENFRSRKRERSDNGRRESGLGLENVLGVGEKIETGQQRCLGLIESGAKERHDRIWKGIVYRCKEILTTTMSTQKPITRSNKYWMSVNSRWLIPVMIIHSDWLSIILDLHTRWREAIARLLLSVW